jgi:hypothetical protein
VIEEVLYESEDWPERQREQTLRDPRLAGQEIIHETVLRHVLLDLAGFDADENLSEAVEIELRLSALERKAQELQEQIHALRRDNGGCPTTEQIAAVLARVSKLEALYSAVKRGPGFIEHLVLRPDLPLLLEEAAAELRRRFDSPMYLSWEDGCLFVVVKTKLKAEDAEPMLDAFLDWWLGRSHVDDRTTVTLDYV